jgi:parallel beta-helix repeat protein
MAAARAGDTVRLDPGTYKETLVLKTGVHVLGGPSTIDATGLEHGIYADTSVTCCASVDQLTVLNSSDNGVTLDGAKGVQISNCAFRGCGVLEGSAGLRMDTNAQAAIENSEFSGSGYVGLRVLNADLSLKNSQVFGNPVFGLDSEGSTTNVESSAFYDNAVAGVFASSGGLVRLQGNHLTDAIGVYLTAAGSGLLENNIIENNSSYGVFVEQSSAILEKNQIRGSADTALLVTASSDLSNQQRSIVHLQNNVIAGSGTGLQIFNSDAFSQGDRFEQNGSGIVAAFGASVIATGGSVIGSSFDGVFARDPLEYYFCANPDCTLTQLVVATVRLSLDHMLLANNAGDGAVSAWGAVVSIHASTFSGNLTGVNAFSGLDYQLGDGVVRHFDVPGTVTVRSSEIANSTSWAAIVGGGSKLDLGNSGGGWNSFVGNSPGAVANNTSPVATVSAEGDWWGTANPIAIAAMMSGGPVDFVPFLTSPPR